MGGAPARSPSSVLRTERRPIVEDEAPPARAAISPRAVPPRRDSLARQPVEGGADLARRIDDVILIIEPRHQRREIAADRSLEQHRDQQLAQPAARRAALALPF